jgi:hypothetical protein
MLTNDFVLINIPAKIQLFLKQTQKTEFLIKTILLVSIASLFSWGSYNLWINWPQTQLPQSQVAKALAAYMTAKNNYLPNQLLIQAQTGTSLEAIKQNHQLDAVYLMGIL